jgi:hypothetical protein
MKSLDSMPPEEGKAPKGDSSADKDLVSMMGMAMLDNGGLQTIQQSLQSTQDPPQVIGAFVTQLVGQMAEMTEQQMGIDPAVYGEPDGFLDQVTSYIGTQLNLPNEMVDAAYGEALEMMKAASQGGEGAPQEQPPQAAPAPGGAPMGLDVMGGM